jgi:hypothetical protein
MKKLFLVVVLAVVAVATLPLWGSCDLNAKACSAWCSVRHFNSDVKTAGCKARCTADKLSCLADKGAKNVEGFVEEFKK